MSSSPANDIELDHVKGGGGQMVLKRKPFQKEGVYSLIKLLTAPPLEEMSHGALFNRELCLPGFHPMLPQ